MAKARYTFNVELVDNKGKIIHDKTFAEGSSYDEAKANLEAVYAAPNKDGWNYKVNYINPIDATVIDQSSKKIRPDGSVTATPTHSFANEAEARAYVPASGQKTYSSIAEATKAGVNIPDDYKSSSYIPQITNVTKPNASGAASSPKPFGIENITSTLNLGSQGDQVKELQKYLSGLGYLGTDGKPLKVDGIYGPQTKTAVMQFQSKNGLVSDGIFGPKSLAKTKEITSTDTHEGSAPPNNTPVPQTKPADDPSNQYNTDTGKLNPNFNPNNAGTSFNTGDPAQDALLKELENYIKTQQDAGLKLNDKLNFDQDTLDKFLETAKKQVHPFYQQQIDTIKQDVLRAAPQILQNYGNDITDAESNFQNQLGNARENYADAGLAFSGQRTKGEFGMQDAQDRNLASLNQTYGNKLYDLGRGAEEKIGAGNVDYNLGALKNYSTNLAGNGGFNLGGSSTPYTPGGYKLGVIQNDEAAAQEARRQALLKSASESVVAGRDYSDLYK